MSKKNIHPEKGKITRLDLERLLNQKGCIVWLTGLSGSGKSTIARTLEEKLTASGRLCYVLDGDGIRQGLNSDLGFSPDDRRENIRRIGEVATLFADAGIIVITAFISPYRDDRLRARNLPGNKRFVEVYLDVPLQICEKRDPKRLYSKARAGEIPEFTGISAPYEVPEEPEIVLNTAELNISDCSDIIMDYLITSGIIES